MSNSAIAWIIAVVAALAAATGLYLWQDARSSASLLEQRVSELTTQRIELRSEVRQLGTENTMAEQRIRTLEARLAQRQGSDSELINALNEEIATLEAALAAAQENALSAEQVSALEAENERLQAELGAKQSELVDLRQVADNLDSARNQASSAEQSLANLNAQLAAKDSALAEREAEIAELRAELDAESDDSQRIQALREEIAELQSERQTLSAEQTVAQQSLDSARQRIQDLLTENEQYLDQLNALQQDLDQQREARRVLMADLQALNNENASLVERYQDGRTRISIPTELLYGSGTAEISQSGAQALAAVAKTIRAYPGYTISVEGHSDDRPIGDLLSIYYPSNWELSTARAAAAVRHLTARGVQTSRIQAVGHAANQPVASNDTASGRAKNRRIEILLLPNIEPIIVTP